PILGPTSGAGLFAGDGLAGTLGTARHRQRGGNEMASRQEDRQDTKFYLEGNFAPVPDELGAIDLPVEGALPPELQGRYLRNGPNPPPGREPSHWFVGDGMLHGVRIEDGRAEWFRSRWVGTKALETGEDFVREDGSVD